MVVRGYGRIQVDRPLQQRDRLGGASALDQTAAFYGAFMSLRRLRRRYLRGLLRARRRTGDPWSPESRGKGEGFAEGSVENRLNAREQVSEARRASGGAETRQHGGRGDLAAA